jgi:hypothetical protein
LAGDFAKPRRRWPPSLGDEAELIGIQPLPVGQTTPKKVRWFGLSAWVCLRFVAEIDEPWS